MDEDTLEALRGSIAKWEGIVAGVQADLGAENCPLCAKFNPRITEKLYCDGCPVSLAVGTVGCNNTPFSEFDDYLEYHEINEEDHRSNLPWTTSLPEYTRLAQAELDFLKSLLPKE